MAIFGSSNPPRVFCIKESALSKHIPSESISNGDVVAEFDAPAFNAIVKPSRRLRDLGSMVNLNASCIGRVARRKGPDKLGGQGWIAPRFAGNMPRLISKDVGEIARKLMAFIVPVASTID